MIRVLAADDHPLALAGLRALLGSLEGIALVGAAASGDEAVRLAAERGAGRRPDGPRDARHGRREGDA